MWKQGILEDVISKGTHERFVINKEKFELKVNEKKK